LIIFFRFSSIFFFIQTVCVCMNVSDVCVDYLDDFTKSNIPCQISGILLPAG